MTEHSETRPGRRLPRVRIGAIVALAAAAGFLVWFATTRGDDDSSSQSSQATVESTTAAAVSESGLRTLAGAIDTPIFWAGPRKDVTYELTRTPEGRTYVRYLPPGIKVGQQRPALTVGTYPVADAYAATAGVAKQANSVRVPIQGGVAFYTKSHPTSVYLAFPGSDTQVEVFDPDPSRARAVVRSGQIKRVPAAADVGGTTPVAAQAVSPEDLRSLAQKSGPIYWVGPQKGVTYELTRTPDGRTYVRYLPAGVAVGEQRPLLTIGSYRLPNAYAATAAVAKGTGSVKVPVQGGIAFYSKGHPTSVYVASPGSKVQVEVFDPSSARARRLVASGRVQQIR
jgi:hypothetical protein